MTVIFLINESHIIFLCLELVTINVKPMQFFRNYMTLTPTTLRNGLSISSLANCIQMIVSKVSERI